MDDNKRRVEKKERREQDRKDLHGRRKKRKGKAQGFPPNEIEWKRERKREGAERKKRDKKKEKGKKRRKRKRERREETEKKKREQEKTKRKKKERWAHLYLGTREPRITA